jgi:transposase
MDLAKYCVNAVLVEHRSHREVAAALGRSKSWVGNQVQRYERGGEAALVLQKRGPKVSPKRTAPEVEDAIITLRKHLTEEGFDAGARTISYHLARQGLNPPALATIHRVLTRRGFVTAQPQKRPRNSFIRFESDLPNECWQSDMTHWKLEGNRHIEVINFVDDHSRAVMTSVVVPVATAQDVLDVFYSAVE